MLDPLTTPIARRRHRLRQRACLAVWGHRQQPKPTLLEPPELGGPVNHVLPAWDVACGLYAAIGLLSAERRRLRTGQGSRITLALADVALAVTGHLGFLAEAHVSQADRPRIGNHLYGGDRKSTRLNSSHRL